MSKSIFNIRESNIKIAEACLEYYGGNKKLASRALGVSPRTLRYWMNADPRLMRYLGRNPELKKDTRGSKYQWQRKR